MREPSARARGPSPVPTMGFVDERDGRRRDGLDDAALVTAAREGHGWAEQRLYERHVQTVARTVALVLGRMQDAEDVVQDTFLEALTGLSALSDPAAFRPWVLRIAVHKCHRRFRRRKLLRALGLDRGADDVTLGALAAHGASPEAHAELARLDAVLRALPERERTAWVLRHVHGHELTEVARLTGVSLATTKRVLDRAQRRVGAHAFAEAGHG
jgi:RNA polymerase sigma-70 factor (ECF subfamily)